MKLLVTGGRNYRDYKTFCDVMDKLPFFPSIIIQGGADGADALARRRCDEKGVHYATVPALWDYYGNGAGPRRNAVMLVLRPEYCLALPGGSGTANMVKKCQIAKITVWTPLNS